MGRRSVIVERDVEMQTRDGVTLRADVYRPQSAQPLPVLLQRTPYDKRFSALSFAQMAADRGYVVVIQDTRGRLASEGEYYPLLHEKADGYDAVEWAAAQPWADGQVGMFGGSYVGYTQLAAASERPPSLKAIAPTMTFCDPYDMAYTGGAYSLGLSVSWALGSDALLRAMVLPEGPEKAARLEQVIDLMDGMASGDTFRRLPVADMPLIGRSHPPSFFADGLAAVQRDGKWGYVDSRGNVAIEPQWDVAYLFSERLAMVARDGKYGFVDARGNVVVEPQWDFASGFSEGVAMVQKDGKWGFIDARGNVLSEPQWDSAAPFYEGLAWVAGDGASGYIGISGEPVCGVKLR